MNLQQIFESETPKNVTARATLAKRNRQLRDCKKVNQVRDPIYKGNVICIGTDLAKVVADLRNDIDFEFGANK